MARKASTRKPVVRVARAGDVDEILALELASFTHAGEMFDRRQVRGLIASRTALTRIVLADGKVIGWAVGLLRRRGRVSGRLYGLAVHPDSQGRGLGRRLAEAILLALQEQGAQRLYLEVRRDNTRAIALYTSMGFVHHADLPDYYTRGVHAIRMVRVWHG